MRRIVFALLLPLLAGCWESEADLFAGETPVTPFKSGPVTVTNADGEVTHQRLSLDGTTYQLSSSGEKTVMALRFYPLADAPGFLAVDAVTLGEGGKSPHSYAVVHPLADGRVEEMAQDCEGDRAEKIGAKKEGFVCTFTDRATLEKALRTLTTEKPTAIVTPG
jgi:hypothetical protein